MFLTYLYMALLLTTIFLGIAKRKTGGLFLSNGVGTPHQEEIILGEAAQWFISTRLPYNGQTSCPARERPSDFQAAGLVF